MDMTVLSLKNSLQINQYFVLFHNHGSALANESRVGFRSLVCRISGDSSKAAVYHDPSNDELIKMLRFSRCSLFKLSCFY